MVDAVAQRDHKKGTNKTETDPEMQRRPEMPWRGELSAGASSVTSVTLSTRLTLASPLHDRPVAELSTQRSSPKSGHSRRWRWKLHCSALWLRRRRSVPSQRARGHVSRILTSTPRRCSLPPRVTTATFIDASAGDAN